MNNFSKNISLLVCIFLILIGFLFLPLGISATSDIDAVEEGENWHFIALGDTRNQGPNITNPVRAEITNHIVANNPNAEFILHAGDLLYYGAEQDDWDRYYEDIENATKNNVTFYYAVGNHERYSYDINGSWGPSEENYSTYLKNVELPGNERFYSFDHNEIHFVIINTEEDWTGVFNMTNEQEIWLRDDLVNHSDDFIVAVFHRPLYSVRDSYRVDDARSVRSVLRPIFIEYDVDLAISGHDHYYYRTYRDNILYVDTGGGGANLATNSNTSEWQEGDVFFSTYHYINLSVSHNNIKVETLKWDEFTQEASVIDTFDLSLDEDDSSEITTTSSEITIETSVSTTTTSTTDNTNVTNLQHALLISLFYLILKSKKRKKRK